MGDIKNKFDGVIEQLNEQEQLESAKSKKVVQAIAGRLFEQINAAYGISNNAAINMLIRDYISEKKGILET